MLEKIAEVLISVIIACIILGFIMYGLLNSPIVTGIIIFATMIYIRCFTNTFEEES